jgi:tRNA A37 threonylcarbamoyltransferase TsaD
MGPRRCGGAPHDPAIAVVRATGIALPNVSTNQVAFHEKYGGIVPDREQRSSVSDGLT